MRVRKHMQLAQVRPAARCSTSGHATAISASYLPRDVKYQGLDIAPESLRPTS